MGKLRVGRGRDVNTVIMYKFSKKFISQAKQDFYGHT